MHVWLNLLMLKNTKNEKLNGEEDATEGYQVRDHYRFNICPSIQGSFWWVSQQDFCEKVGERSGKQEVKYGCQQEG